VLKVPKDLQETQGHLVVHREVEVPKVLKVFKDIKVVIQQVLKVLKDIKVQIILDLKVLEEPKDIQDIQVQMVLQVLQDIVVYLKVVMVYGDKD